MTVVEIMLSIAAAASVFCGVMLIIVFQRGELLAKMLEIQLKGLGETYLQGLEILTMDVDKLKAKVKELEDEVL